jgi:hypothetical protein
MTALQSGLRSLPFTVLLMVTAPVAGRLANRSGFDVPVTIGAVLAAIGLWTLSRLHPATPYVDIWWRQVIVGTGFGLALSPLAAPRWPPSSRPAPGWLPASRTPPARWEAC